MIAVEKCAEISEYVLSLLDASIVSEMLAEHLALDDEEMIDLQYAEALVWWERDGRPLLDSFVTNNALFLHFRQAIQNRFGLEILSAKENAARKKVLKGQVWLPTFVGSC